jgi:toxin ParE1/3/4
MKIIWSPEAIDDLISLRAYVAEDNPAAAQRIALHIVRNIEERLADNPQMGRPGRVSGTREFVIPRTPYIVPYRVRGPDFQSWPGCAGGLGQSDRRLFGLFRSNRSCRKIKPLLGLPIVDGIFRASWVDAPFV